MVEINQLYLGELLRLIHVSSVGDHRVWHLFVKVCVTHSSSIMIMEFSAHNFFLIIQGIKSMVHLYLIMKFKKILYVQLRDCRFTCHWCFSLRMPWWMLHGPCTTYRRISWRKPLYTRRTSDARVPPHPVR